MNGGATRRSVLAASLTVPLLAAASCGAPAAATPPAGPSDVTILREAIAAKAKLIGLYTAVRTAHPELAAQLDPLLADNEAHLAELERRLIEPAHGGSAGPGGRTGGRQPSQAPVPATPGAALAVLRAAESAAAGTLVGQLRTVAPSLAQLLASIAACEATHAAALASRAAGGRIR